MIPNVLSKQVWGFTNVIFLKQIIPTIIMLHWFSSVAYLPDMTNKTKLVGLATPQNLVLEA